MKKYTVTIILLVFCSLAKSQVPVGSWSDHLVYNTARNIAISSNEIYASTGSSILIYNKEFSELRKLSHVNGLSETGISSIAWSDDNKTLIIAYTSTNVDLLSGNTVHNIPDISRKYIPGKKVINRIRTRDKYAYLMCSFGIVVIDIQKREVYDTWKPGPGTGDNETWDIAFRDNRIFAATEAGLYTADLLNPGLSFFGNWSIPGSLTGRFNSVINSGNRIYANKFDAAGDYLLVTDAGTTLFQYFAGIHNNSLEKDYGSEGFTVSSPGSVNHYSADGSLQETISSYDRGTPFVLSAVAEPGSIWIADQNSGLVRYNSNGNITRFSLPGPASNDVFYVNAANGKTLMTGGGVNVAWTNIDKPLQVSVFENNTWTVITSNTIHDAMRAVADPSDNSHFFVSTWGGGLLEYKNNEITQQYNYTNSPLQTIIPGQPYVRICGITFDKSGNLWIAQSEVPGNIKVLKPGTKWIVNPVTIEAIRVGDIIISQSGKKWIVLPRGPGLFVFDDNNTPDNFSDDRTRLLTIKDSENKIIPLANTIAEDADGNIWIGTDEGPLVYYNPDKVFDTDLKASRIKVPRNDGSGLADYLLSTESISSIAVDGANRKWIGTRNSGAYLISPDGLSVVKHFTEQSSPMLSDNIISLSADNRTGEVWFATSRGVVSYRGDAPAGEKQFTGVYAFPNPVRQEFKGNVTIRGLMTDSQIRITDVSGNLVYKTVSHGGEASWDLTTYNGKRVATGVYLIFCASSDGKESTVTKVLVIK